MAVSHDQSLRLEKASRSKRFFLRMTCWVVYLLYRALRMTCTIREHNLDNVEKAKALHPQQSYNLALWHENIFASIAAQEGRNVAPMISESADGELVTFLTKKLGFFPVRGSSSSRGQEAKAELERRVSQGVVTALTVDGPRGPRRKVKAGIVMIAQATQTAILPMACIPRRYWTLRSWDRFRLPKPFTKLEVVYGEPIMITEPLADRSDIRNQRTCVEQALNELDDRALQLCKTSLSS